MGRRQKVDQAKKLLDSTRLMTLTGTGGVGKSRLALQVAHEVKDQYDDVGVVELASISAPALIAQTVASALRVREVAGKTTEQVLTDHLRAKKVLLILDNCERLADTCARLCDNLLRNCLQLQILATSRAQLRADGEQLLPLSPLEKPDPAALPDFERLIRFEAVILFTDRAASKVPDFSVTPENAPAVAQVCWRLDGIPLAIELAAARIRIMTVQQILDRLHDRFGLLTGGPSTALPHQQTMRATVDWSYDLLNDKEKTVFQCLSVFAGGWTLEAAETVCADEGILRQDILNLLTSLSDNSLVVVEHGREATRYQMLDTLRQYGCDRLQEVGAERVARERHLEWSLFLAGDAELDLIQSEIMPWLDRLDAENDNLRAALSWCQISDPPNSIGLRLAVALTPFWIMRGYYSEGRQWFAQELMSDDREHLSTIRARALRCAGRLAGYQGDYTSLTQFHERALIVSRTLKDQMGIALGLEGLAGGACDQDDFASARASYEEALSIFQELDDQKRVANGLVCLGVVAGSQGNSKEAQVFYEDALAISQKLDDQRGIAICLGFLAGQAFDRGDLGETRRLREEALTILRAVGDKEATAHGINSLGSLALEQDDHVSARVFYEEALTIFQELGDQREIGMIFMELGEIASRQSDSEEAQVFYEDALAIFQKLDDQRGMAICLTRLANEANGQGNLAVAQRLAKEALVLHRKAKKSDAIAIDLTILGRIARKQGDLAGARNFYEEALVIYRRKGNQRNLASGLNNLAEVAFGLGEHASAEAMTEEELAIHQELNNKKGILACLQNLAGLAHDQGNTTAAQLLMQQFYGALQSFSGEE